MFLFKRSVSLTKSEYDEIQECVGKTIESMLITKEETIYIFKQYDTVLSCSLEGNYIVMDIYQLSKFSLYDKRNIRRRNTPFYTAARSLDYKAEIIVYYDVHKEKGLGIRNLQAFYYICDLLNTLDIDVFSAKEYKCVW